MRKNRKMILKNRMMKRPKILKLLVFKCRKIIKLIIINKNYQNYNLLSTTKSHLKYCHVLVSLLIKISKTFSLSIAKLQCIKLLNKYLNFTLI